MSRTTSGLAPSRGIWLEMHGAEAPTIALYRSNRPGPKLRKWLHAFPDRLECGCVRAKSAIDLPMLASTGVKRIEWMSPAWGPVTTVAIPEICPRSLILLALIMRRLESSGISALRSVSTWFCQIKPPDQLKPESKVLPTTWPLLLMPVALEALSSGRIAEDCECAVRLPERGDAG